MEELFVVIVVGAVYLIPTIIAFSRGHHNAVAILLVNLFFGVTLVGWVAALFWSLQTLPKPSPTTAGHAAQSLASPEPVDAVGPKFIRARIEVLRERLDRTRSEIGERLDKIESEVTELENALGRREEEAAALAQPPVARSAPKQAAPEPVVVAAAPVVVTEAAEAAPALAGKTAETSPQAVVEAVGEPVARFAEAPAVGERPVEAEATPSATAGEEGEAYPVEEPVVAVERVAAEAEEAPLPSSAPPAPAPALLTPAAPAPAIARVDWEALIGGSWLNVIGIIVLLVGMVLLTQHSLRQFGPLGRTAVGVVASLFLLLSGLVLERRERYALFARTLMGGGWALLYFMAYAVHSVEAARIVTSPVVGLFLLLAVAAGMIVHALGFRSQLLTGLAYGLGFFAVALVPVTTQSLFACAILAASQIVIMRLFEWQTFALVAVVGAYLNHWRWLEQNLAPFPAPEGGALAAPAQTNYWLSLSILGFYWALFVVASLMRGAGTRRETIVQLTISVANSVGMLGMAALQIWTMRKDDLYLLTGVATAAYATAAFASWLGRRTELFRFNGSVAVFLYAATLPLALEVHAIAPQWLSVYWLAGGLAAAAVGLATREALLRLEAYLLCGLTFYVVFAIVLPHFPADWRSASWWFAPVAAVAFLALSDRLQRATGRPDVSALESVWFAPLGYGAAAIVAAFLQKVADPAFLGLALVAAGFLLAEIGFAFSTFHNRGQGYLLLLVAAAHMLVANLSIGAAQPEMRAHSLWLTVGPAIPALYAVYWRASRENLSDFDLLGGHGASLAATLLFSMLLWRQVDPSLVALAWLALAVALLEAGARFERGALRLQAYGLFAAALVALAGIDLFDLYPLEGARALTGARRHMIVGLGAAVYYYLYWRLGSEQSRRWRLEIETALADAPCFAGSGLLAALAWREADPALVGLVWLSLALALFETGAWTRRGALRLQAYALFVCALAALLAVNLYELYPVDAPGRAAPRWLIVGIAATIYYYLFWRLGGGGEKSWRTEAERVAADAPSVAGTALLAIAIWKESGPVSVALGWASLALALFEIGRASGFRRLEAQGHVMAAFAFGRLFLANFLASEPAALGISQRVVTVVPVAALLYHLRAQTKDEAPGLSRWHSYGAALLLVALARFELGRADWIMGLAPLLLALLVAGIALRDRDFRYQAYVVAALAFARVWSTNVYLTGGFYGLPERLVTILPLLLAMITATALCLRYPRDATEARKGGRLGAWLGWIDRTAEDFFAFFSVTLAMGLIYCEAPEGWVTSAWALEALALIVVGFAISMRSLRYYGLFILLLSLLKLAVIDLREVEAIYRILSYIVLGVILLLASFVYTRRRDVFRKYM